MNYEVQFPMQLTESAETCLKKWRLSFLFLDIVKNNCKYICCNSEAVFPLQSLKRTNILHILEKRLFFPVEKCRFGFLRRSHKKGKVRCFATSNFLHAKFVFLIKSCPNPAKERMEVEPRKLNLAR